MLDLLIEVRFPPSCLNVLEYPALRGGGCVVYIQSVSGQLSVECPE